MKVLLMGLDNAGKTSIARHFFENKTHEELEKLKPTEFIETGEYFYRQLVAINLFDCGGQQQFMKAYRTEDFKSQVFSQVDVMIWVVDSADKTKLKQSCIEFSKLYILLEENSPQAVIHILAHKTDKKKMELNDVKKAIGEIFSKKVKLNYHSTSIKNNSTKNVMKRILDSLVEQKMGDRLIKLQDLLHKLNNRVQSGFSILFNAELGVEIASAFEEYLEPKKTELLEYISLKLTDPPLLRVLTQFKKQGFLKEDRSDFTFYRVGEESICIAKLHPSVSLFIISAIDSLAKIEKAIKKYQTEILTILQL